MNRDDNLKREFNETLAELVEFATVSGNKITREQVRQYFNDVIEDEKNYEFIYKYLTELKIEIDGVDADIKKSQPEEKQVIGKAETDEAKAFYDMYMDDLKGIETERADKAKALKRLLSGDCKAVEELTEIYLSRVVEIAGEYVSSSLSRSDLVAEGNLALFEGNLAYRGSADVKEYEDYIDDKIRKSMERAVYQELGSGRTSNHLVERINALNDASEELAKELGREASLEELSERLSLSEDEIKELMRISINALTVDEGQESQKKQHIPY